MYNILKYSFFDQLRSRWSLAYALFYAASTTILIYLSADISKVAVSLMNLVLILTPLTGTLFGMIQYYNSREFLELLLAQPVRRSSVFLGLYLGISLSLCLSMLAGVGLPLAISGELFSGKASAFLSLMFSAVFLTLIFTGISFTTALYNENRLRGFGLSILIWLLLVFVYDGVFLTLFLVFEDYPLERFALAGTLFNPVDLARVLILLELDLSAIMGYSGAVFKRFFGTGAGMAISASALLIWSLVPLFLMLIKGSRKDF
jgi:Cu-processing system permease protein